MGYTKHHETINGYISKFIQDSSDEIANTIKRVSLEHNLTWEQARDVVNLGVKAGVSCEIYNFPEIMAFWLHDTFKEEIDGLGRTLDRIGDNMPKK